MESMVISLMVLGMVVASFIFVGWIIWMASRHRRERQQNEIELRARMLDKFGSSEEFTNFMQTDAGRRFLDTSKKGRETSRTRVASALATGAIFIMLGAAFFFMSWQMEEIALMFPGSILGAVGVGLAITAFIYSRFSEDDNGAR